MLSVERFCFGLMTTKEWTVLTMSSKKNLLPQSVQVGNMVGLPTPCGDIVFYPLMLAMKGQALGEYSAFMTISHKSNIAYLVVTVADEAKYKLAGKSEDVAKVYEGLPWKEIDHTDPNGDFFYKEVPSDVDVDEYFKQFDGLMV